MLTFTNISLFMFVTTIIYHTLMLSLIHICSEDDDDGTVRSASPTHDEATTMLEGLMTYFEKQNDTSSAELLTLRCLRDRTAKRRQSLLKQKNITDFFK